MSIDDDFADFMTVKYETQDMPEKSMNLSRTDRKTLIAATRKEILEDFLTRLPDDGETMHIVSNGKFDYYSFVKVVANRMGTVDKFYGSTWTMNRDNVRDLLERFDRGQIKQITIFTGTYFKRRETSVYATVLNGLVERGQRFLCFKNHAKVMLFEGNGAYYVCEGSANFTANPRLEQNILVRSKELYEFHQRWMEEMIKGGRG